MFSLLLSTDPGPHEGCTVPGQPQGQQPSCPSHDPEAYRGPRPDPQSGRSPGHLEEEADVFQ